MKTLQLICVLALFFCTCASNAQNFEWRFVNSPMTAFAHRPDNPGIIFAGDQAGLIRRSDDRGATWRIVSRESEITINDIAFLNADKGFAATAQPGLILVTTDGGNTWHRKQLVDAAKPDQPYRFYPTNRIVVVDDQTAFFDIFNHPISSPSAKETIVTRDGGAYFRIDSMPGEVYHVSGETMIAFGREKDMFGLSKFTVYKSTDKGMSWDTVKISPAGLGSDFNNHGINIAFFLNENEFFLTANKNLSSDKYIYKTTDGGQTFTPLGNFSKAKVEYLYFKSSSEGFMVSSNANGSTTFTTTDGGTTWVPSSLNLPGTSLYLGNDTFIAYYDDHTAISTDFGKSWTEQADPINTIRSSGTASMSFLQLIDNSTAVASLGRLSSGVYSGRNLMQTTDGGLTWYQMKGPDGADLMGETFHFVSKDTFFFIGSGYNESGTAGGYMKIKYTTDGGKTAKDVFTGGYWEDVVDIIFIDKNNAVTYSMNSSTVNYSTDAGQTWTSTQRPHQMGQLIMMDFPDIDNWYAVTSNKKLFRSTDRGKNWNEVSTLQCTSIHFTDAMTGYAYGCRGEFYKTTDGGQTWTDLSAGIAENIRNNTPAVLAFRTPTTAYMSDPSNNNRSLAATTDGGNTWQAYSGSQVGVWVAQIDVLDDNTAAMMDRSGNIAWYTGPATYTTDTVRISTDVVSVGEIPQSNVVALYPNPASDAVVVETNDARVRSIEIADLKGRICARMTADAGSSLYRLDTRHLPAGMYIVRIDTAQGVTQKRLYIVR